MSYAVWGWGGPSDEPTEASLRELAPFVADATGITPQEPESPRPLQPLAAPKRVLPDSLAHLGSTDDIDRARHGIGRAYRELVLAMNEKLNRLIDAEVGEDRGQMMPGGIEAGWEVTPETMAGA